MISFDTLVGELTVEQAFVLFNCFGVLYYGFKLILETLGDFVYKKIYGKGENEK